MDTTEVVKSYVDHLEKDGVVVIKQLFSHLHVQTILDEVNKIRKMVHAKIDTMERPLKTYSDIAEREPGRLDYRCGFNSAAFTQLADPVINFVKQASPHIDLRPYWGVIPSLAGSGPTPMHRDVYPFLNTSEGNDLSRHDINLPPYYFTVLIPLVQITKENGPTQFIRGSHRLLKVAKNHDEIYAPLLSPGDIVVFDGRTMHKGSANNSAEERVIAYITFVANWYHDQTFAINDYLFK